jgi:hypothetical protein
LISAAKEGVGAAASTPSPVTAVLVAQRLVDPTAK